jgi:ribosome-binding ATPase YchF (GTP1/OBG family)
LNVPAENFPFCTIDPNLAKTYVPDKRFDKLVEIYKPTGGFRLDEARLLLKAAKKEAK